MPLRVLLDAGVVIHSEFAEPDLKETPLRWSDGSTLSVSGLKRKRPSDTEDDRKQKEALFTVGRMIREHTIEGYTYSEIDHETNRGAPSIQEFNALYGCTIHKCEPAVERSRFFRTSDFRDFFAKGGKKDRRAGLIGGGSSQIDFLQFLSSLDSRCVDELVAQAGLIGLTQFEIDSLRDLVWFQFVCERSGSSENYPDMFHLWTAKRNHLDAFLTLETKLPNIVNGMKNEKKKRIDIAIEVLRPLDLLHRFGISAPDPVPINAGRFYPFC
jgi:hypothetical protein